MTEFLIAYGDDRDRYLITNDPEAPTWKAVVEKRDGERLLVHPKPDGLILNQHGARLQPGQTAWEYHETQKLDLYRPGEDVPFHTVRGYSFR